MANSCLCAVQQEQLVGAQAPGSGAASGGAVGAGERPRVAAGELADQRLGRRRLDGEQVAGRPFPLLGPELPSGGGVGERGGDPHAVALCLDGAGDDAVGPERLPDRLRRFPGVLASGGVGQHEDPGIRGEVGDHLLGQAARQPVPAAGLGLVLERQHRDRGAGGRRRLRGVAHDQSPGAKSAAAAEPRPPAPRSAPAHGSRSPSSR